MEDYKSKEGAEKSDILDILIGLPQKNLESRIKQLEQEIYARKELSDEALLKFGNHQLRLEEIIRQLRYVSPFNQAFSVKKDFQLQLQILENHKINEIIGCFKDVSLLQERLQNAREELELEKQRQELIKGL
jgi:hypothetical protein